MATASAQLYSIREHTQTAADLARSLKRLKQDGWPAVQVSSIGPIPDGEIRRMLDDNDLTCVSSHISYGDMAAQNLKKVVETQHALKCPHTALSAMPAERRNAAGYAELAKVGSEFAKALRKEGIGFGYHNHSFDLERFKTSKGPRSGLQILLEDADPQLFGLELDTYWVQHGGGDPAKWTELSKGRVPVIHLKDMVVVNVAGKLEQHYAPVGAGNLNWPAILSACERAGVSDYVVEQDESYGEDPFDCLKTSLGWLKKWGVA